MKLHLIVLGGCLTIGCLLCFAQDGPATRKVDNPWPAIQRMVRGGRLVEGLEKAAEAAKANPRDRRMGEALAYVGFRDSETHRAARAPAAKLCRVLAEAFKKTPHRDIATNLLDVATDFQVHRLLTGLSEKEVDDQLNPIAHWDRCTPELYVELGESYKLRKRYKMALKMLSKAVLLAEKSRRPRRLRRRIAYQQGEVVLARDGKHAPSAVPFLQRVVQLDRKFASSSNRALCKLGSIALAQGDAGLAKTYLSLAGRVNRDPTLWFFGYERGLALELIEGGHPEAAIEYLSIAYKKESEPDDETVYGLGLGYLKKGDKDEAIKWFKKYLTLEYKPKEKSVRNMLHILQEEAKQPAEK